jgi:hypothetical protein
VANDMALRFTSITVCMVLAHTLTCAQEPKSSKWEARVRLDIDVEPNDFKSELTSYLSRELRALGDITIVQDNPTYFVHVLGFDTTLRSGARAGYTFAAVGGMLMNREYVLNMGELELKLQGLQGKKPSAAFEGFAESISGYRQVLYFQIFTTSVDGLRSTCEKLVAALDTSAFQPRRTSHQMWQDVLRKANEAQGKAAK